MPKVLLVEDEMLVRELAYEDLTAAGFEVTASSTGDEALAILRDGGDFDVLFTDIRFPGQIDGWELAAEGKRLIPGLKVVYATGLGDSVDQTGDGDRVLVKPYRSADLLKAVS